MGQVIIRNIDDRLIARLKARAAAERKSLEQSLRELLTEAAAPTRAELLADLDRIRAMTPPLRSPRQKPGSTKQQGALPRGRALSLGARGDRPNLFAGWRMGGVMVNDISRIAHGGKRLYGARVGILMLETSFPRIPGDPGNGLTWPFPVLYKVVPGATPDRVVRRKSQGLGNAFLDAAAELVHLGADGITTTCGFLSLYQREIVAHVGVPVATSSLMQIPLVERILPPEKRVGVLTVSAASLTAEHLVAAGADPATPVIGTEGGREFTRVMLDEKHTLDAAAAE